MDEVCNKLEGENSKKTTTDVKVIENAKRSGSPVFKCVNRAKPLRGNNLDSSDYDIPSYQINQSVKSRTSSKYGSETSESVLPFSPIFSPIPITSTQYHPPSIHSLGTVAKASDKSCKDNVNSFPRTKKDLAKPTGLFESLGMNDKDISWVSSMASPPPKQAPGNEFNTIEKATFFPEEKFQNIQPRALFSPDLDEDFDCRPISFCSESEDDEAYKSNVRLSDVCATLKQLEVKSLEQVSEQSVEHTREDSLISPVIKTKKKKCQSAKKVKKGALVVSPDKDHSYEFSLRENKNIMCDKPKSDGGTNFIDDDSFQSMSFSCIDELCKTLVTEGSDSSAISRSVECTFANTSTINSKTKAPKIFYESKSTVGVCEVSSIDDLHSYAKALEEGNTDTPVISKIEKSYADKGIVRFDIFIKESDKVDATKRLHSEVTEENDTSNEKKFKKLDDENTGWEKMKEYLSESQLNVSDGEMFRTVENLEKTLASQDSKDLDKLTGLQESETTYSQHSGVSITSKVQNPERRNEEAEEKTREYCDDGVAKDTSQDVPLVDLTTALGFKMSESKKGLEKAKEFFVEWDGNVKEGREKVEASCMTGFMTSSGKQVHISAKALEKAKALMKECDESVSEKPGGVIKGPSKCRKFQKIPVSYSALEKAKMLWADCEAIPKDKGFPVSKGFFTGSGKAVSVSAESLEKAKALMSSCEQEANENSSERNSSKTEDSTSEAFSSCKGVRSDSQTFDIKGKKPQASHEDQGSAHFGFSPALSTKIKISSRALGKAKSFWGKSEESVMKLLVDQTKAFHRAEPSAKDFTTAKGLETAGSEAVLSDGMMKKEQKKAEDWKNDCVEDKMKTPMRSTCKSLKLKDSPDESEEIIPGWLHVYSTSPSVASDRTELSPLIAHEDGKCSRPAREYMVKSPVLGSGDRFHGKKKRKVGFEEDKKVDEKSQSGFVVPYKDSGRKGGAKRTSGLSMDFSIPFKRVKFVEMKDVVCDVREERGRRRGEQEKAIEEKQSVKPCKGLHLRKKCSEKQMSWMEAVGGSSPDLHSEQVLKSFGVVEDVLRVSIGNAASFTFGGEHFFGPNYEKNIEGITAGDGCVLILDDENKIGVRECKRGFLASSGVQPSLVPEGWVENHYKWIVWKLAHYERSFPRYFAGRCLTPNNVMLQLKYRYDREIDGSERSALKKILERDDTSGKRLVLCVCGIEKIGGSEGSKYELSLTDGWYSCPARPDAAMTRILNEGKLLVGTKLMIQGAVLVNGKQGVPPLEISGDVHLRISTNSTRRTKWDTKLGFQKNPQNFPISLSSVLPQGGPISRIDVIVVRVYPVLYMEKTPDGRHVTRNRRSEEKADAEFRRIQEQKMESICNEARMEMKNSVSIKSLDNFDQVEGMCELLGGGSNPSGLREEMTAAQRKYPETFQFNQNDRFTRELSQKIEKRLEKEKFHKRNVSEFFRTKVVDFRKPDYNNPAVLSVWHPNEDLGSLMSEGKVVSLFNVTVSNSSRVCKPLQMNTTRQTQYVPICRSVKYPARKLTLLKDISSKICPAFEEVDLVGVVLVVRDISYESRMSQVVYLTDLEMHFVGIVFWGGSCKDYGWENALRIRSVVACSNLQWKKNYTSQSFPSLHVNENSVFTENPKQCYLKEELEKLKQSMPQDLTTFLSKCEEEFIRGLEESKWLPNLSMNLSENEFVPRGMHFFKSKMSGFESKPTASSTPIKPFPTKMGPDQP